MVMFDAIGKTMINMWHDVQIWAIYLQESIGTFIAAVIVALS